MFWLRSKALLFDLDGTLIDSRQDLADAVNFARKALRRPPVAVPDIVKSVGNGVHYLIDHAVHPQSDAQRFQAMEAFRNYYSAHLLDNTTLYEGVEKVLRKLSHRYAIGLVTNKPTEYAQKIIERLRIAKRIKCVIGGDSIHPPKPHPSALWEALKLLGCRRQGSFMIGDGLQDVIAGKRAEVQTIACRYGFGYSPEVAQKKPDYEINRIMDLKEILL